jgi:hypothetical protein
VDRLQLGWEVSLRKAWEGNEEPTIIVREDNSVVTLYGFVKAILCVLK